MPTLNLNISPRVPTSSALVSMALKRPRLKKSQSRRDKRSSNLALLMSKLSYHFDHRVFPNSQSPPLLLPNLSSPSRPSKVFAGVLQQSQNFLNRKEQSELSRETPLPLRLVLPWTERTPHHQPPRTNILQPAVSILIAPSSSVDGFISTTWSLGPRKETWYVHKST